MKRCLLLLVILSFWEFSLGTSWSVSTLQDLANTSFSSIIPNSHNHTILEFYSTNCPHCQEMILPLEIVKIRTNSSKSDVVFYKVNALTRKELAKQFKVSKLPTIAYFMPGEIEPSSTFDQKNFQGKSTKEALLAWIDQNYSQYEDQQKKKEKIIWISLIIVTILAILILIGIKAFCKKKTKEVDKSQKKD